MKLKRKDFSIFPTQHGFLFLGILAAMLMGAVNYNNNAGFILVFLLGGMALISLFHSHKNLGNLEIHPLAPQPVFPGEPCLFPMAIKAEKDRGQALSLGFANKTPVSFSSGHGKTDPIFLKVLAEKRGILSPRNLILTSVFPFGLFCLKAQFPCPARGLVYPAPEVSPLMTAMGGDPMEGGQETANMGPDDFQGLKPYTPGNNIGHISWKALSRGQGLFIKDFTAEVGQDIILDLDLVQGKNLEQRLSRLCHMVLGADKLQRRYGLKLGPTFSTPPDTGDSHRHKCLKALALFAPITILNSGKESL